MKEIHLLSAGLPNDQNLGDPLLLECTKKLYSKILARYDFNVKWSNCDIRPRGTISVWEFFSKRCFSQTSKYKNSLPKFLISFLLNLGIYFQKKAYSKFFKEKEIIKGVIVAGGGLFHFKTHPYLQSICALISLCKKYHIPIIINSVGIEDYNKDDPFFNFYRRLLNDDIVKAFTTRDGIFELENDIIYNKNIYTALQPDTAILTDELILKDSTAETRQIVGIGLIRPDIFTVYKSSYNKDTLLGFYIHIIQRLKIEHINYEFFTNGLDIDSKLLSLIEEYFGEKFPVRQAHNISELVNIISGYKALVVLRMLAAIICYSLRKPCAAFSWNKKLDYFFNLINRSDFLVKPTSDIEAQVKQLMDLFITDFKHGPFFDEERRSSLRKIIYNNCDYIINLLLIGRG